MPEEGAVEYWVEQIKAGMKYRKKFGQQKRWRENRDYYRGKWKPEYQGVNIIYSQGRALISRVVPFYMPRVTVTATHPSMVTHARVVEAIDNWLIRETLLKRTLRASSLDAYLCGTGPIKLGFDSEYGYDPMMSVGPGGETATQEGRQEARAIEYKSNIKPGMPWAMDTRPEDVVVPYGYKYESDLPWIAHRIWRPIDDVKQDQKYENTGGIKGGRIISLEEDASLRQNPFYKSQEINMAELWEIRDYRDGRIVTICEDQLLLSDRDALQIEGLPWEFIIFNEDPEHFWGTSDVSLIRDQQLEINDIKTQQKRHRAIALLKFLALKGVLTAEDRDRLLSGDVGPFVEIDAESLAASIDMLQPHVPPDFLTLAMDAKNDVRETLGFDTNQLGAFKGGTPPTATETATVSQGFDSRISERRDIVSDVLVSIVRKWNQFLFSFWQEERVIQVVGPAGDNAWVQYTGDQLKGEYLLKVDPDAGHPVTQELRMQAADKLLNQFGGDKMVDSATIKRHVLEQFDWIFPGVSQALNQQLPPELAMALAADRQPTPIGGNRNPQGNRGGGQRASTPEQPVPLEKYRANQKGGGGK